MAEHRAVLLFTVSKAKRPAHVHLDFMEVGIEPVPAEGRRIEVFVARLDDVFDHLIVSRAEHDREDLRGQHHAYSAVNDALNLFRVVVVIAVKPSCIFAVRHDLVFADVLLDVVSHQVEVLRKLLGIHDHHGTGNTVGYTLLVFD